MSDTPVARAQLFVSLVEERDLEHLPDLAGHQVVAEVRADRIGTLSPQQVRDRLPGSRILYTLRSRAEGGAGPDAPGERSQLLLAAAAAGYDFVDLEAERDLEGPVLGAISPQRRLLSWHGTEAGLESLRRRWNALAGVPAAWYKLVPEARRCGDEFGILRLLAETRRRDLIGFAAGAAARWSRLVAPRLGAAVVFAAAGRTPAVRGQPTAAELIDDYDLPRLGAVETVCGVVGGPGMDSLSPRLHNAAYRELGLPALFLPFPVEDFGDFWLEHVDPRTLDALGLPLRGLAVTAPHKSAAAAVAGALSPAADILDAANTLVRREGVWEGESTDGDGVIHALRSQAVGLDGLAVAVLGAGGAGRAAAAALRRQGARVVVVHRDGERAATVARQLGVASCAAGDLQADRFPLIVQATPLGSDDGDPLPLEPGWLAAGAVGLDLVYRRDRPSDWVLALRATGRRGIDGREVLIGQAVGQFRMMTGRKLPVDAAYRWLGLEDEA